MAVVSGAVVSVDGQLTSLEINSELTIEGSSADSISAAKAGGANVIAVAAGIYNENRDTYDSAFSMYGVDGSIVTGGKGTVSVDKDGGGLMKITAGESLISGMTFAGNNIESTVVKSRNGGGAIYANKAMALDNCVFDRNTSGSNAGAVLADKGCVLTVYNTVFSGNESYSMGGAVKVFANADFRGATFSGNIATNRGGAISVNSEAIVVSFAANGDRKTVFKDNVSSQDGGAINVATGGINVSGTEFSNNISSENGGAIIFKSGSTEASYLVNTSFNGNSADNGGAIYVETNSNGASLYLGDLTFDGNQASIYGGALFVSAGADVHVTGLLTLKQAGDTIYVADGGVLTVDAAEFLADGAVFGKVIDTGFVGEYFKGNIACSENYQLIDSRNDKYIAAKDTQYVADTVCAGTDSELEMYAAVVDGQNKLYTMYNGVNEALATGKSNIVFVAGKHTLEERLSLSGKNLSAVEEGAIISGKGISASNITVSGLTFSGNKLVDGNGAALSLTGKNYISGTLFYSNAIENQNGSGDPRLFGGAIYISSGTTVIENCRFQNNSYTGNVRGGAVYVVKGNVTLRNVHSSGSSAQAMWFNDSAVVTIENSTIEDTVLTRGSMTVAGDVHIKGDWSFYQGSLTINGNLIFDVGLKMRHHTNQFTFGENGKLVFRSTGVSFVVNGDSPIMDLGNSNIVVDIAGLTSGTVVATGVTQIGAYDIIGNDDLMLSVNAENKLVVSKMAETVLESETVSGTGSNLVTSGSTDTFIANRGSAATLLTTVTGGSIEKNFIGGAFAKAEDGNAKVENSELNIGGEADVKGQVYAGGYFYGTGTESTEAQMTVNKVNIKLDGNAKVNGNLYAGIHARAAANVKVNEISISIKGGAHDRIYAGGWAEGNSYSEVGESTVTLSGGTVNFVYGGGANGQGATYVGATTITVKDSAEVGTIFMSGRYGYSATGDVELNWYGQNDMKRLSGVSSAGIDNAASTLVNLYSDLTVDGIDFVDKFVLAEGVKLTANVEFLLGNRTEAGLAEGATTFDFTTDGLTEAWDAIAGIDDFEHALFSVNGSDAVTWDGKSALAIGNYELSYNDTEKTVTLKQLA